MTTATRPTATLPLCPQCKAPAKHALEMRDAEGNLKRVRYQCSDIIDCDHVWNDPPLPKVEAEQPKGNRHPFGATFAMPQPARLDTITAPAVRDHHAADRKPAARPKAKRTLAARPCKRCGEPYTPTHKLSLYCSKTCSRAAADGKREAPLPERPCDHCGKQYAPSKSNNRFCSRSCQTQARIRRKKVARGPQPLCLNCQQPFRRRAVDHVYCSAACKSVGRPKRVVRAKLSLTERTCQHAGCGKPFVPKRSDQRFCCTKCLKADGNARRTANNGTWLTCPQCGERFKRRTPVHTYCTPACREAARVGAAAAPEAPPEPTTKACERCGEPYEPKASNQRFCSDACRIWWGNHLSGRSRTVRSELAKEARICVQCQQPYTPTRRDQRCCSKPCTKAYFNNGGRSAGKADAELVVVAPEAEPSTVPAESLTATLAALRARYAERLEAVQAAVDACDVLLALERGERNIDG